MGSIHPTNNGIKGLITWLKAQVPASTTWPDRLGTTLNTLRVDHDSTEKRLTELEAFKEVMETRPF